MTFKLKMNSDFFAKLKKNRIRTKAELERFYKMPARFKARTLLAYARAAKEELPELLSGVEKDGYNGGLVNIVIPGIAYRLGETELDANEMNFIQGFPSDPQEIRDLVGRYMSNAGMYGGRMDLDNAPFTEFLGHCFVNGNVITMALDELAPPTPESNDWIARHMREISRSRFGDERYDAWCPEFQEFERANAFNFGM